MIPYKSFEIHTYLFFRAIRLLLTSYQIITTLKSVHDWSQKIANLA